MKKKLALVLSLCLMLNLFPAAALAVNENAEAPTQAVTTVEQNQQPEAKEGDIAQVGDNKYTDLQKALDAASTAESKVVTLLGNVELSTQVTIPAGVTLDGKGHTISVSEGVTWSSNDAQKYMLVASGEGVTVKDLVVDAESNAYGCLQFYKATNGNVSGFTGKNAKTIGLMVNASTVTATGTIQLEGNGGKNGVNVGFGSGISDVTACSFDASAATFNSDAFFYTDASDVSNAGDGVTFSIKAPEGYVAVEGTGKNAFYAPKSAVAAQVGDKYYATLPSAIAAAPESSEVKLLSDVTLDTAIVINKKLTLDLNTKTITNNYVQTGSSEKLFSMVTKADVTIKNGTYNTVSSDSNTRGICQSAGNLTLDHVKSSCTGLNICNYAENGKLTISNSTISGSYAVGSFANKSTVDIDDSTINGTVCGIYHNGSYYGLNMTVDNSIVSSVTPENKITAVYISGSTETTKKNDGKNQQVAFTNCTVSGDTGIEVKFTDLTLTECTVSTTSTTEPTFEQYNNGSTTSGFSVVATDNTMKPDSPAPGCTVTINNGSYKGLVGLSSLIDLDQYPDFKETDYIIYSGYFTSDPSAYVAEGKAAVASDKSGYAYMVTDSANPDVDTAVKTEEPVVNEVPAGSTMTEEEKFAAKDAAASIGASNLEAPALSIANNVTEAQAKEMEKELTDAGVAVNDDMTIVIQPYLDITPVDYDATTGTLELDIVPMYKTIATTNPNAIDLEGEGKNAVEIGKAQEMNVTTPVTITFTKPSTLSYENLYIQHVKEGGKVYYYKPTVSGNSVTFVNPNGFSTFIAKSDARTGTISFSMSNGTSEEKTYTPADVGSALPTDSKEGATFKGWTIDGKTYTHLTDELLTILSNAGDTLTATPVFEEKEDTTEHTITVKSSENGKVTSDVSKAKKGTTVTLTVTPDKFYKCSTLVVTDKDGNKIETSKSGSKYTFTMPASDVTVSATFVWDNPFIDVKEGQWFYDAVKYVHTHELFDGMTSTQFQPDTAMSRGMMVTVLYRMEGKPATGDCTFADVEKGSWYEDAIAWASSKGIVNGMENNLYRPDTNITREQMITIFFRYATYKGYDVSGRATLDTFADGDKVASWATDAMKWAVKIGLIEGDDNNALNPQGNAKRSEMAAVFMRFCQTFEK